MTEVPWQTVQLVRARDLGGCVRCRAGSPLTTQHRRARGAGGDRTPQSNTPSNLLTLCGSGTTGCHGWVEHNPTEATRLGYRVARFGPPASEVPVWYQSLGWVLLTDDGLASPTAPTPSTNP